MVNFVPPSPWGGGGMLSLFEISKKELAWKGMGYREGGGGSTS